MANHAHATQAALPPVDLSFITQQTDGTRYIFRGNEAAKAQAFQLLSLTLANKPLTAVSSGHTHALWLGPDETLFISETGKDLAQTLDSQMSEVHSTVNVSHRQLTLTIRHPQAEWLLQAGCPLDLHISQFPIGTCTRTQFEKTEMVLWRTAADTFKIEIWRSFAEYLTGLLALTAAEL
jgi:sarcosine oxidase, subunit gamma